MKKSISITINNLNFQIDEDAYQKLDNYLASIRKHYGATKEGREILFDIEAGIAEKFSKKISGKKQSIQMKDVEEIIKVMGTVKEFSFEEEKGEDFEKAGQQARGGFGRKLFRNPDDQIIGGVCSGLALYLGIDSVFVRLFFILLTCLEGIGIIIYLVLWLVMPLAKTNAQKLEMQGQPVNLKKIEEVVKEKSNMVKKEGRQAVDRLKNNKKLWYRILNFPIKVLEVVFSALRKFFAVFFSVMCVFIGVIFIISFLATVLALVVATAMLIFNINSPYLISDLPLGEISASPMYLVAVISAFFIALVPVLFLLNLGFTMARRKNTFRAVASGILVGLWMIALAGICVSAGELAPQINARLAEIRAKETMERVYDYKNFEKVYLGARAKVKIVKGDKFAIKLTGLQKDLDSLNFKIEDKQLQITQSARTEPGKICIFCLNSEITGEIVLPKIESYVGVKNSAAVLEDFKKDIFVSLGEAARLEMKLDGQSLACKLSGVGSKLILSGKAENLTCVLDGYARLETQNWQAKKMDLKQGVFSRVVLAGSAEELQDILTNYSRLYAFELKTDEVGVETRNYAKAEVYPLIQLKALAIDYSRIYYQGELAELDIQQINHGKILRSPSVEMEEVRGARELGE